MPEAGGRDAVLALAGSRFVEVEVETRLLKADGRGAELVEAGCR